MLAERVGITGENIFFSSNDTPAQEYVKARELGAIINLDDISHIPFLEQNAGIPELISFRYNPGPLRGGNAIIGHPEDAKYGFTKEQLFDGYRLFRDKESEAVRTARHGRLQRAQPGLFRRYGGHAV